MDETTIKDSVTASVSDPIEVPVETPVEVTETEVIEEVESAG